MPMEPVEARLCHNVPDNDIGVPGAGDEAQPGAVKGEADDGRLVAGEGDLALPRPGVEQANAAVVVARRHQASTSVSCSTPAYGQQKVYRYRYIYIYIIIFLQCWGSVTFSCGSGSTDPYL